MKKILVMALAIFCTTGCVTAPKLNTSSGTPEIEITTSLEKLSDYLVARGIESGYQVKSQTKNSLIFERADTSFGAKIMFGSKARRTPNRRLEFNFYQKDPATVKVRATCGMVTNPGTGLEEFSDLSASASRTQDFLLNIRARLEGLGSGDKEPMMP